MPNWVYNTLVVTGSEQELNAFGKRMSRPYTTYYSDVKWVDGEAIEEPGVQRNNNPFSFWNIHAPNHEIFQEYFSVANHATMPENNWYNWNVKHWGTKWDASDVEINRLSPTEVVITFSTAWSPVTELLIRKLSPKFPGLTFVYEYEEEQGWGGKFTFKRKKILDKYEWDIPNSHADYVEQDKEDSCRCAWEDDEEFWYDDCPREEQ